MLNASGIDLRTCLADFAIILVDFAALLADFATPFSSFYNSKSYFVLFYKDKS